MLNRNELARNLQISHSPYKFLQVNHSTYKFLQVNHLLQETCKILQVNHLLQETCKFLQVNHSVSTRESRTIRPLGGTIFSHFNPKQPRLEFFCQSVLWYHVLNARTLDDIFSVKFWHLWCSHIKQKVKPKCKVCTFEKKWARCFKVTQDHDLWGEQGWLPVQHFSP